MTARIDSDATAMTGHSGATATTMASGAILSANTMRFYAVLLRLSRVRLHAGERRGICCASYSSYARLMNCRCSQRHCSLRSVHNYVRALRQAGWIDTLPQPGDITAIRPLVRPSRDSLCQGRAIQRNGATPRP